MHRLPRGDEFTFDSVNESRVNALAGFGFTQRQRQFLVTVMVHAGCFLERQYCAFTSTVRGQNSREFARTARNSITSNGGLEHRLSSSTGRLAPR